MQFITNQQTTTLSDALPTQGDNRVSHTTHLPLSQLHDLTPDSDIKRDNSDQFFDSSLDKSTSGSKLLRLINKPIDSPSANFSSNGEEASKEITKRD